MLQVQRNNLVTVKMVVLANSFKHGGRCVAGKCLTTKKWIRPVSDQNGGAIPSNQATAENIYGKYLTKPLQKISLDLIQHVPLVNQPENFLIKPTQWQQNYKIKPHQLNDYIDEPDDIWGDNSRVSYSDIKRGIVDIDHSIYLVSVDDLKLFIDRQGKRKVEFSYHGISYCLPATDPNFNNLLNDQANLMSVLCISLACKYKDYCYKVVATIF
jgi:hypothetical protein